MDNAKEICSECGKKRYPYDSFTPFGTNYTESGMEPLDEEYICKRCFPKVKAEWLKRFKEGERKIGNWQKSRAEREAAKECGLVWLYSGIGILCSQEFIDAYQYVTKRIYKRFSELPYYGWCKVCGFERKGGYCSNRKCSKTFKKKFR